jgi:hypothetical protein
LAVALFHQGLWVPENAMLNKQVDYVPTEPPGGLDERFCEVMDAASVMIWVSDTHRNCVWLNRACLRFTGRWMNEELGPAGWGVYIPTTTNGASRSTAANSMLGKNSGCSTAFIITMARIIGLMTREFHGTRATAAS